MEVPAWLKGGPEPSTVSETMFRSDRLKTMRMRLSAAYKGVNALLMKEGAQDFRSGQKFDHTIFFGENVDIHHIFPKAWCKKNGIKPSIYDSIINKTPLSYKTNRMIGGVVPSDYLGKLETGDKETPSIDPARLDGYLATHLPGCRLFCRFVSYAGRSTSRILLRWWWEGVSTAGCLALARMFLRIRRTWACAAKMGCVQYSPSSKTKCNTCDK